MKHLYLILLILINFVVISLNAQWSQIGNDIDGEAAGDDSGISVCLNASGNIIIIGAQGNDDGGAKAGHARVWEWDGSAWNQKGNDMDGEAGLDWFGTSVAIDSTGNIVAVGSDGNDNGGSKAGHVKIFQYNSGMDTWDIMGSAIEGHMSYENAGESVSLSTDGLTVAIGCPQIYPGSNPYSGCARVFYWDGDSWEQKGSDINGEDADDEFGRRVDLSADGNRVIACSEKNDSDTGHARVYEWNGSVWQQIGNELKGNTPGIDFAHDVSISHDGNIVAVGARFGGPGMEGMVKIYEWDGMSSWIQKGDSIIGENMGDYFGGSVSLNSDGSVISIGAYQNSSSKGHVRVYKYSVSSWSQVQNDIDGESGGDRSGWATSINANGSIVASGAYEADGINGTESGHARVFKLNVLPVEFIDFKANQTLNHQVELKWSTASESNNDYFKIERSSDSKYFESIGKVQGNGTTNTLLSYAFIDKNPLPGVNYYRLKQVDFNGEYDHTNTISIKSINSRFHCFPNPVDDKLIIQTKRKGEVFVLEILDIMSSVIMKEDIILEDINAYELDCSELKSNTYILKISGENGNVERKIFIKK